MTGPIAPPTILIIFVAAEEIPVYSLGVNEILVLFNVRGRRAPAIPNRNRPPLTACDVEWNSVSNKNEMAEIRMPGTSSFVFSPFLFPMSNPKTGPRSSLTSQMLAVIVQYELGLVLIQREEVLSPIEVCQ